MKGVEEFVAANYDEQSMTFNSCLQLLIYGYFDLQKANKKYSRKEIQKIATQVRGRPAAKVELEDYLRNDLIDKHIHPFTKLFELENYLFQSGAEEFSNNIKTGILDIKVCSPLFNGTAYFVFECKRLNKSIADKYATEGVSRFVEVQYYPQIDNILAGMISFLESHDSVNRIDIKDSYQQLSDILIKHKKKLLLQGKLNCRKVDSKEHKNVNDFEFVYLSNHKRKLKKPPIGIYHLVFDYNDIVVD